jgi:KRAB domain-containing zinc finger protein
MENSEKPAEKKFECFHADCKKSFPTYMQLVTHLSRHRGSKLFNCDICTKKFSSQRNLRLHELDHADEPLPYKCFVPNCGRSFKTVEAFQYHTRSAHTKVSPFVCKQCGRSMSTKQKLQKHTGSASCAKTKSVNEFNEIMK